MYPTSHRHAPKAGADARFACHSPAGGEGRPRPGRRCSPAVVANTFPSYIIGYQGIVSITSLGVPAPRVMINDVISLMSNESSNEETFAAESGESLNRRLFLRSLGKWSGSGDHGSCCGKRLACLFAGSQCRCMGQSRRRGRRSSWINRGGWVNRAGGWINRAPGGWINRRIGGGSSWINRW